MCNPEHEARLFEEYCGSEKLLRKLIEEYFIGLKELADSGVLCEEICGKKVIALLRELRVHGV